MRPAVEANHVVVHRDRFAYSAHPHLVAARPGLWLLVFTQSRRREGLVIHPPQDPMFCNMLMHSSDEGRSWSAPTIVPHFRAIGVECAGLTALSSGAILINQWQFEWHTLAHAERHLPRETYRRSDELLGAKAMAAELGDWAPTADDLAALFPWARGGGTTFIHRSEDGGLTFPYSTRVETSPFSGGYGMRGGIELEGEIVLPLCDVPNYRQVFVVRSVDGGRSWSVPTLVASGKGHAFEEPAPLLLRSGRVVMALRDNETRLLHLVHSDDGGRSWSAPRRTGIADYPADLIEIEAGVIGCIAGRRRPPFGIALYLSTDQGETFDAENPIVVRGGLPNRDLGYPSIACRGDGTLYAVYYAQDGNGVTGIDASLIPREAWQRRAHGGH